MSKEENSELIELKRKKKRVENAINSQSKRLKLAKNNGSDMSSINRTLKNSKEALVRIDNEIDVCEGKEPVPPKNREIIDKFPKDLTILLVALVSILVLTLTGVIS